eukprot:15234606-Alexandrium_andersonii.AAC.1
MLHDACINKSTSTHAQRAAQCITAPSAPITRTEHHERATVHELTSWARTCAMQLWRTNCSKTPSATKANCTRTLRA